MREAGLGLPNLRRRRTFDLANAFSALAAAYIVVVLVAAGWTSKACDLNVRDGLALVAVFSVAEILLGWIGLAKWQLWGDVALIYGSIVASFTFGGFADVTLTWWTRAAFLVSSVPIGVILGAAANLLAPRGTDPIACYPSS